MSASPYTKPLLHCYRRTLTGELLKTEEFSVHWERLAQWVLSEPDALGEWLSELKTALQEEKDALPHVALYASAWWPSHSEHLCWMEPEAFAPLGDALWRQVADPQIGEALLRVWLEKSSTSASSMRGLSGDVYWEKLGRGLLHRVCEHEPGRTQILEEKSWLTLCLAALAAHPVSFLKMWKEVPAAQQKRLYQDDVLQTFLRRRAVPETWSCWRAFHTQSKQSRRIRRTAVS